jgi:chromosome segregation ATPase
VAAVKLATAEAAAEQADARLADAKAVIDAAAVVEGRRVAEEAVAAAQRDLAAEKTALDAHATKMEKLAVELAAADKTLGDAQRAVAKVQAEAQAARLIVTSITDAISKIQQALAQLKNDTELSQAIEKLAKRAQPLAADLKTKETALASAQAVATSAAQRQSAAKQAVDAANVQATAMRQTLSKREAQLKQREQRLAACNANLYEKQKTLVERTARQFGVAGLKPLTTEQLAYCVMRAVGIVEQQHAAADAEWAKKNAKSNLADRSVLEARIRETEPIVHEKLAGNLGPFLPLFATAAGQPQGEFFATADQALFFANGGHIRGWLAPGGGNLTERLVKQTDARLMAEELY